MNVEHLFHFVQHWHLGGPKHVLSLALLWSLVCGPLGVSGTFVRDVWGQNYFQNSVKTLFAFFTALPFLWWCKSYNGKNNLVLYHESRQWHWPLLYFSPPCTLKIKIKPVHLIIGVMRAVKLINFIWSPHLSTHLLNKLCVTKWELWIRHLCYIISTMIVWRKSTCSVVWVASWTNTTFPTEYYFYLKEQTN